MYFIAHFIKADFKLVWTFLLTGKNTDVQWNLVITRSWDHENYLVISGFSLYQGKKTKKYGWDQQNYQGFCYIRPRYNEVPLYSFMCDISSNKSNPHSLDFSQKWCRAVKGRLTRDRLRGQCTTTRPRMRAR